MQPCLHGAKTPNESRNEKLCSVGGWRMPEKASFARIIPRYIAKDLGASANSCTCVWTGVCSADIRNSRKDRNLAYMVLHLTVCLSKVFLMEVNRTALHHRQMDFQMCSEIHLQLGSPRIGPLVLLKWPPVIPEPAKI